MRPSVPHVPTIDGGTHKGVSCEDTCRFAHVYV